MKKTSIQKSSKKIPHFSRVQKERIAHYKPLADAYLLSHPICERCKVNRSTDIHHKEGRDGENMFKHFLAVCRPCHEHIEMHPKESKEEEWSASRLTTEKIIPMADETLRLERHTYTIGDAVTCINIGKLPDREVAPPLALYSLYTVKSIAYDSKGNQHLDVGLASKYEWITSFETGERLYQGDKIHWCHPSRFVPAGWKAEEL